MPSIARRFRDVTVKDFEDLEVLWESDLLPESARWQWSDLLESPRVLIVAEAGAGKTHECRTRCAHLWTAGEPAFFLELAALARAAGLSDLLTTAEESRFDAWRTGGGRAVFFLDSIDELQLTSQSFGVALRRFGRALGPALDRAHVVITTRPIPFDRQLIERELPLPPIPGRTADELVERAVSASSSEGDRPARLEWRIVGLMPLTPDEFLTLARGQGVADPERLLDALQDADALDLVLRPQDAIEVCAFWLEHGRLGTYREQMRAYAVRRLRQRVDRPERVAMTPERAWEGATTLALGAMLTRKFTVLLHSDPASGPHEVSLDAPTLLPDFSADDLRTLLERPLFGLASYGRVRFQHRSVLEYLAAERLSHLLSSGKLSPRAVLDVLTATDARGTRIVRPALAPVAAWLAGLNSDVRQAMQRLAPTLLLTAADPASLPVDQRASVLTEYVAQAGALSWRGETFPIRDVRRLAHPGLGTTLTRLWHTGVVNPDIRTLLLRLAGAGCFEQAPSWLVTLADDPQAEVDERALAMDALASLSDPHWDALVERIAQNAGDFPDALRRELLIAHFPSALSVPLAARLLAALEDEEDDRMLRWHLARIETTPAWPVQSQAAFVSVLLNLITPSVRRDANSHATCDRQDLVPALVAHSAALLAVPMEFEITAPAVALALMLTCLRADQHRLRSDMRTSLEQASPERRRAVFWALDDLLLRLNPQPPEDRFIELVYSIDFSFHSKDIAWCNAIVRDPQASSDHREMMLHAAFHRRSRGARTSDEQTLTELAGDHPRLMALLARRRHRKVRSWGRHHRRRRRYQLRSERARAKAQADWKRFVDELIHCPEDALSPENVLTTYYYLQKLLSKSSRPRPYSHWDRAALVEALGVAMTERLKTSMHQAWRQQAPRLLHERQPDEPAPRAWWLAHAGLEAEAEDPHFATILTPAEAMIAVRLILLVDHRWPDWFPSLYSAHSDVITPLIIGEIATELSNDEHVGSWVRGLRQAPAGMIDAALPVLRHWLEQMAARAQPLASGLTAKLAAALSLWQYEPSPKQREALGDLADAALLVVDAEARPVWWLALLASRPTAAVEWLEQRLDGSTSRLAEAQRWLADLFGRPTTVNYSEVRLPDDPALRLRLVRWAYTLAPPHEDVRRVGSYTPDARDRMQSGRSTLLSHLLAAPGLAGWEAKQALAADVRIGDLGDRLRLAADQALAQEADENTWTDIRAAHWHRHGEVAPATPGAMAELLAHRLDDVDTLLASEFSPRDAWRRLNKESLMRRELARFLNDRRGGAYTVDQEAVTGAEKETDIRLRSMAGPQAVIELKLGDDRSLQSLRDDLEHQLVRGYLSDPACQSGAFVVTIAHERSWRHPVDGTMLDFDAVMNMLADDARRLSGLHGVRAMVKGFDLR